MVSFSKRTVNLSVLWHSLKITSGKNKTEIEEDDDHYKLHWKENLRYVSIKWTLDQRVLPIREHTPRLLSTIQPGVFTMKPGPHTHIKNFEDKSLQIKPNKKTNKEWHALFSQKHRDFGIFIPGDTMWRIDLTVSSGIHWTTAPLFSQNIQPKCILRFLWLTEDVLNREVCLILIVK